LGEKNEIRIASINRFLEIIEELSQTYHSGNPTATKFLFRGVTDENYPLLPSVFRKVITKFEAREIHNSKYTAWSDEAGILKTFIAEPLLFSMGFHPPT